MIFRKIPGEIAEKLAAEHSREPQCSAPRALSASLLWDYRVNEERAQRFKAFVEAEVSAAGIPITAQGCLRAYADAQRESPEPEFIDRTWNQGNFRTGLNQNQELLNVLNLTAKYAEIDKGVKILREKFRPIEQLHDFPTTWNRYVTTWLPGRMADADNRRATVEGLLEALRAFYDTQPPRPIWATARDMFDKLVGDDPHRWLEALGLIAAEGHWVVLLTYPVAHTQEILRPTILDAGPYYLHMPSPPLADAGYALDRCGPMKGLPLEEWCHRSIGFRPEYLAPAGQAIRFGCISSPSITEDKSDFVEDLREIRRAHWSRLTTRYGPADDWPTEENL